MQKVNHKINNIKEKIILFFLNIKTFFYKNKQIAIIVTSVVLSSIIISIPMYVYYNDKSKQDRNLVYDPSLYILKSDVEKTRSLTDNTKSKKVTILIATDPECFFCKKLQLETIDKLINTYEDRLDFKYVFVPLHQNSQKEIMSILCVSKNTKSNNLYYNYIKKIFENTNSNNTLKEETLWSIANNLGLNTDVIKSCTDNNEQISEMQNDYNLWQSLEIDSTPQIFILKQNPYNDTELITYSKIIGARGIEYFEKIINKGLE